MKQEGIFLQALREKKKTWAALDRADVYLDDECVAKDGDVLKEDRLIRDRLGYPWRGGE